LNVELNLKKELLLLRITWIFLLICAPYYFIFEWLGITVAQKGVLPTVLVYIFTLIFCSYNKQKIAILVLILGTSISLTYYSLLLGISSGAHLLLLPLAILPILLNTSSQAYLGAMLCLIPLASLLIIYFFTWNSLLPISIALPHSTLSIINLIACLSAFALIIPPVFISNKLNLEFSIYISNQSKKLLTSNRRLNKHLNWTKQMLARIRSQKAMEADLEKGRKLQHAALPQSPPKMQDIVISHAFDPAKTLSGDFFYYFPNMATATFIPFPGASEDDDDHHQIILNQLGVVVADVVGKGVAASLEMFSVKTVFKLLHEYWFSPKELVTRLNAMSADSHLFSKYVPLIYATLTHLNHSQYALRYVNAGHEYGVVIKANGETIILDQGGAPAGMDKDEQFVETELVLDKHDTLFLFTDGCTDVKSPSGDSIGFDELLPILHLATQHPPYDIARFVRNRLQDFQGKAPQADDMTIVAFFVC
jgi:serine phosphatase RsbU (regulator of sigma subunit)